MFRTKLNPITVRAYHIQHVILVLAAVGLQLIVVRFLGVQVARGNYGGVIIIMAIMLLLPIAIIASGSWRSGVVLFFVWITFEDLIRKFIGNNILFYFSKDILIGIIYLQFFLLLRKGSEVVPRLPKSLKLPLLLWLIIALIQSFNPGIETPLIAVVGLRMMFIYVPLLFVGYAWVRNEADARGIVKMILVLGGLAVSAGALQVIVGTGLFNPTGEVPHFILNFSRGIPGEEFFAVPTSFFANGARYGRLVFITLMMALGSAYCFSRARERLFWRWLAWLIFGLSTGNVVFLGGRGLLLTSGGVILLFLLLILYYDRELLFSRIRGFVKPAIVLGLALFLFFQLRPESFSAAINFYRFTVSPTSPGNQLSWRIPGYAGGIWEAIGRSPVGHGTGTASLGLEYVYNVDPYREVVKTPLYYVEGGYSAVVWEYGFPGLVIWLWWTLAMIAHQYRAVRGLQGSVSYELAVAIFLLALGFLFPFFFLGMQTFQDYIINSYFWFLSGILFKLSEVAQEPSNRSRPADEWLLRNGSRQTRS